ncbi:hypothetical protein [Mesorhizobium sp. M1378]|uniref:hypothetical protein n=1 Tax=Mesorhizobium sp. M1378 TaxID=2957092 RepID=UPI00333AE011
MPTLKKKTEAREAERAKLIQALSYLNVPQALEMFWAVNMLQSDKPPANISRYLTYPASAAGAEIGTPNFALKWEMENVILLMLANATHGKKMVHPAEFRKFETACKIINQYKTAKIAENDVLVNPDTVVAEMARYQMEQFLWQREFFHSQRMHLYYFIYGQGECAAYFKQKYGIGIDEFALNCVGLYTHSQTVPWHGRPRLPDKGIALRQDSLDRTVDLISKELFGLRELTRERIDTLTAHNKSNLAYLPSTLRQFPMISSVAMENQFIAPFPQLIIFRATSGLYFDLCDGPKKILEEANDRFEQYGKMLIEARCPRFKVMREQPFGTKKRPLKTPDLLVQDGGQITIVFECKATKLTFQAQYAENQYEVAAGAYDQIAKGMSQLWRFFARARNGTYANIPVAPDAVGVVLTLESWFALTRQHLPVIRAKAEELCADEPNILPEDRRDIVFCSIDDLDDVLAVSDEDQFMQTLRKSSLSEHDGWQLASIRNPSWEPPLERKAYPFHVGEIIPLWDEVSGSRRWKPK